MDTIVAALGGNALLRRHEAVDPATQVRNVRVAARAIAPLAAGNRLVVTHGNGPQVGLLALEAAAYAEAPPFPLDVLDAETEGMIGYLLAQELGNAIPDRPVATVLTQVEVRPDDPAFGAPSKPIGPVYDTATARDLATTHGWAFGPDGDGRRRLVPSPAPVAIVELPAIRILLDAGVVVVCAGGGGIPVVRTDAGLAGVEAVVDKDSTTAALAESVSADCMVLLTDVDGVYEDWGTDRARRLRSIRPEQIQGLHAAAGSMGPKLAAAARFARHTGRRAAIGRLEDAAELVAGTAGTVVGMLVGTS